MDGLVVDGRTVVCNYASTRRRGGDGEMEKLEQCRNLQVTVNSTR